MYYKQSCKELQETLEELEWSLKDINSQKNQAYEMARSCKEIVRKKSKQNEIVYEAIRGLEENIILIQQILMNQGSQNIESKKYISIHNSSRIAIGCAKRALIQIKEQENEHYYKSPMANKSNLN